MSTCSEHVKNVRRMILSVFRLLPKSKRSVTESFKNRFKVNKL